MSTQPPTSTMPTPQQTTTRTTDPAKTTPTTPARFRGGRDRWRSATEPDPESAAAQAPRTFDPFCRHRLPNRMDDENQAMLRDRNSDTTETA